MGTFAIECGQASDAPLAEGSLRLPAPYIVERSDIDAIFANGAPSYVTEAWSAQRDGCEHQYQAHLAAAGARERFEDLARKLGVTPSVSGMRFRLEMDAPGEGDPYFVMVEPVAGGENVVVNILHRGVDVRACMQTAVDALPAALRTTNSLYEVGAHAHYVSIVRDEGTQPWCHADFEWFYDKKIIKKVRAWIEGRGRKIGKDSKFAWDDGGDGFVTGWSVSFSTARRRSSP